LDGLDIAGLGICSKSNLLNEAGIEACLSRFDNGSYAMLQFLRAVSHAVGAHTESLYIHASPDGDSSDEDEDTLKAPTTSGSLSAAATVASATDRSMDRRESVDA